MQRIISPAIQSAQLYLSALGYISWWLILNFSDLLNARKSVRSYLEKEVEEEKLVKILEAARTAPSWANRQCWSYIVVKDKARIGELGSGLVNSWLKKAPVIIAACGNPSKSGSHDGMDYYLVDVAISMEHLVLAAADLELGTCWIGSFEEAKVKRILGVPDNIKVVALTPVGYPAEEGLRSKMTKSLIGSAKRKPLEEMVHRDHW
jgi:nitroreductase